MLALALTLALLQRECRCLADVPNHPSEGPRAIIKDNQGKGEGLETGKGPLKVYIKPIFLNLAHQKSHIPRVTHL